MCVAYRTAMPAVAAVEEEEDVRLEYFLRAPASIGVDAPNLTPSSKVRPACTCSPNASRSSVTLEPMHVTCHQDKEMQSRGNQHECSVCTFLGLWLWGRWSTRACSLLQLCVRVAVVLLTHHLAGDATTHLSTGLLLNIKPLIVHVCLHCAALQAPSPAGDATEDVQMRASTGDQAKHISAAAAAAGTPTPAIPVSTSADDGMADDHHTADVAFTAAPKSPGAVVAALPASAAAVKPSPVPAAKPTAKSSAAAAANAAKKAKTAAAGTASSSKRKHKGGSAGKCTTHSILYH